jgi:hypothetical protein
MILYLFSIQFINMRISLGSDCSIAYNLQILGLREESFPFDWILSKNVVNILKNNFEDFCNPKFLKMVSIQDTEKFCKIDKNFKNKIVEKEKKNKMIRVIHNKYKIQFLHDFTLDFFDVSEFFDKYQRRIERFIKIMKNENIQKHLYRICKHDEREELERIFHEKKFVNWTLHIKLYSEFPISNDWKRTEFDWKSWFS